jgi:ketosteroid isomerase-like protein
MGENADKLKQGWEAFGQGDLDGASEFWADDITWDGTNDDRLPLGGRIEGRDAVKEKLASLGDIYESFNAKPDEFHDSDDTVIVLGHNEAKAKETGTSVKVPFVQVWRFQDGKASEVLALTDTFEVAKALGHAGGGGGADE